MRKIGIISAVTTCKGKGKETAGYLWFIRTGKIFDSWDVEVATIYHATICVTV